MPLLGEAFFISAITEINPLSFLSLMELMNPFAGKISSSLDLISSRLSKDFCFFTTSTFELKILSR